MTLTVVGAGLPRTATESLRDAFATLLGAPVHHLRDSPGHPYVLGEQWAVALTGGTPDWDEIYAGYVGGFDWPTARFWRELAVMMEHFAGTSDWDDRAVLGAAYDAWVAGVRADVAPARLLDWQVGDGWEPLCSALDVPVPDAAFPWLNRREDWLY